MSERLIQLKEIYDIIKGYEYDEESIALLHRLESLELYLLREIEKEMERKINER